MTTQMTNLLKEVNRDIPPDVAARYKDDALFIACGCVLLERDAGKTYAYKAVNLETGRSAALIRTKKPLTISGIPKMVDRIRKSPVAGPGRNAIDMVPGANLFHDRLHEVQKHIFKELLPEHGYFIREKQMELAEHILQTLTSRAVSLAEAEVGTGKTLAYLVAAVLAKRGRANDFWLRRHSPSYAASAHMPVVVSTSSIALQNAVVKEYIPTLSLILMEHGIIQTPLSCVIRKGREHYACDKNLHNYYKDADETTQRVLDPLMAYDAPIDLADVAGLTPYMKRRVCVSGHCAKNCPRYSECRYQQHMEHVQSNEHDFQVCNHNYFLADVLKRKDGGQPLIPYYQAAIIDEGHKFLGAARQMYGVELPSLSLPHITTDIRSFTYTKGESGEDVKKLAVKLAGQSRRLFKLLEQNLIPSDNDDDTERFKTVMDAQTAQHLRSIGDISDDLILALKSKTPQRRHKARCDQALWELAQIRRQADTLKGYESLVYWMEKAGADADAEARLCAIPKKLDEILYADIWSKNVPVVFTSGTLSAAGDFTHIKRGLGLGKLPPARLMETSKPSPFNYKENAMLYISEGMPFPDNRDKRYIAAVADETERLIKAAHGHTAVLFTSYKVMDQVREMLEGRGLPFPLFQLGRGKVDAIYRFRQSKNGVLLASGALWEGIDLPGDILSMLIIVKLPFAVPDPISEYERTQYRDMAEYKTRVVTPEMLIKLKQGFGRLIRGEWDTGVVALLDSRVQLGKAYRSRALAALPPCRVTSKVLDVENFIYDKKETDYFLHSQLGNVALERKEYTI